MNIVEEHKKSITTLCEQHKVKTLFVFGSAITSRFNTLSDIDLIVEFKDINLSDYADNYFHLKRALEKLFNRSVDLLEETAIKNPFLKQQIDSSKQAIYGC